MPLDELFWRVKLKPVVYRGRERPAPDEESKFISGEMKLITSKSNYMQVNRTVAGLNRQELRMIENWCKHGKSQLLEAHKDEDKVLCEENKFAVTGDDERRR